MRNQTIAERLGKFVGQFRKSRDAETAGSTKKPIFLKDLDKYAEWYGGDISDIGAAARRAAQNPWFFSGVNIVAQEISVAEAQVFISKEYKEDKELPNHPLELVLNNPNSYLGKTFIFQYTVWWLELSGDAFWFLTPNDKGEFAEIWPVPSEQIEPITGGSNNFIDYYELKVANKTYKIPPKYICHFKYANPFDIHRGLSRLIPAMISIDGDNAMARWNATFFGSDNVMPSSIINISSGDSNIEIDEADIDAIKNDLMADYPAFRRKTIVTTADNISVTPLGYSAKDMDFDSGRRFSKEEILIILGIPAGVVDKNVTEASANEADRVLKEKKIWPLLCLMAEQINAQIVSNWYDEEIVLKFKDIRPTQNALDSRDISKASGVLTIDEVREKYFGVAKLKDGSGSRIYGIEEKKENPVLVQDVPVAPSYGLTEAPSNPQFRSLRRRYIPVPRLEEPVEPVKLLVEKQSYIKTILENIAKQLPAGTLFKYSSYQDLTIKNGVYQKGIGKKEHYREDLWSEGYAAIKSSPMPVHHTWWTSTDGEVHDDSDIADEILEYYGLIFSSKKSKEIESSVFISDLLNGSPLLNHGIEEGMLYDIKAEQQRVINMAIAVALKSDLVKWEKKAIKAFKEKKEDGVYFDSDFIFPETKRALQDNLVLVKSEKEIKDLFARYTK